jgi:hypothetical protein
MMVACILLATVFLAFGIFLLLRPRLVPGFGAVASKIESIDVDAFLNLIDDGEENYLRQHLSPRLFRKIHRERMFAAMQYAWHAATNARLLIKLAEMGMLHSAPDVAGAAERLYKEALSLRVCALQMLPRLLLSAAIPGRGGFPNSLASTYDATSCRFLTLARLQLASESTRAA